MMAVTGLSTAALADKHQKNKNFDRNAAIAGGAVALYGLHSHNTLLTVGGIAGAAYAGKKYEDERKAQARNHRRYHRHHRIHRNY